MDFKNLLSIFAPRLLGAAAAWGAAKVSESSGVAVDPASLTAIGLAAYSLVHKAVSSKTNPGDAASRRVTEAVKDAAATGTTVVIPPKVS